MSHIYNRWMKEQHHFASNEAALDLAKLDARAAAAQAQRTLGYVTKDDCPGDGDDTIHTAIPFASVPDYVQSPVTGDNVGPTDKVDVIFLDFIAKNDVVRILNGLQTERTYASRTWRLTTSTPPRTSTRSMPSRCGPRTPLPR